MIIDKILKQIFVVEKAKLSIYFLNITFSIDFSDNKLSFTKRLTANECKPVEVHKEDNEEAANLL